MRILLVEDDAALSLGITRAFEREGWRVDALADGHAALAQGLAGDYDMAVLDLGLPRRDGMSVLRHWRAQGARLPVLLLTARDELTDRVQGLDAGADDYLTKPFDLPELMARLRALKRRADGRIADCIDLGPLRLDLAHRELTCRGERVPLSPRELALAQLLMQRAGRVVTKDSIVAGLSSWEADFSGNSVEVYVHRLRKHFAEMGVVIKTVRGFGYVIEQADGASGRLTGRIRWPPAPTPPTLPTASTRKTTLSADTAPTEPVRHGPSLRRQLLQPLFWVWVLGMALAVLGAVGLARTSADRAFDSGLQDRATALASKVVWSDRGPLLDLSRQAMELDTWDQAGRDEFVMVDLDAVVLAGNANVPVPELALRRASVAQPRLFNADAAGAPVRGAVFSIMSPMLDRMVSVVVVEPTLRRATAVRDIQVGVVLPTLAMGAVTFGLLAWSIRRGLGPLRDVAAEVAARGAHDWQPLALAHVLAEVVPLISRINTLLDDVQRSLSVQRRFIADAAHQLRTPVAGMGVMLQELGLALDRAESPQDRAALAPLVHQLRSSSDRMARLIGQLLSLARSETALATDAQTQPQDIVPVLREACEPLVLQALAQGRQVALETSEGPLGPAVMARVHPLWLGEAVVNLLDNALRYGGNQIEVRVRRLPGGGAEVVVEDDGPGVGPDELPRLFEPFWRGERADTRNDGGTGLGLAIAREIIERQGGSIDARSRPQVAGLRVTVRLAA